MALKNKQKQITKLILAAVVFAVTWAVVMKQVGMDGTDYNVHAEIVTHLGTVSSDELAYPMWHFLVYAIYRISLLLFGKAGTYYACAAATSLINLCIYYLTEAVLSRGGSRRSEWFAFGLCFTGPLYLPFFNREYLIGQGSPVTWHNPTNIMVKPFALLAFFLTAGICRAIEEGQQIPCRNYLYLAALVFLSVLAKPSFFQGFVPALGIYILIRLIRTKFAGAAAYLRLCAAFIPGFLVIVFQLFLSFYTGEEGSGFGIGWFEVARIYSRDPWVSLFLVLAFPLLFLYFNRERLAPDTTVRLAVIYTAVSWLEYALLYENGPRKYDGNFEWAVLVAYTVIWLVTTLRFTQDRAPAVSGGTGQAKTGRVLFGLWLIHLLCGICYVIYLLTTEVNFC